MGAGACVQSLPATNATAKDDIACAMGGLSAEQRQKLHQALAILEGEESHEPTTSPYPSLLGSTRLPEMDAAVSKGGYGVCTGGYGEHPNMQLRQQ